MNGMPVGGHESSGSGWVTGVAVLAAVLLLLAWLFVSATLALRGDNVEKPNRIPQFYGFTVCLLAIIVGLITIASIIGTLFDRANPLDSSGTFGESLTSFAAFKATDAARLVLVESPVAGAGVQPHANDSTRVRSDSSLRVEYDARVADRVAHVRYDTNKSLVTNGLLLLAAIVLFAIHWKWLRRMHDAAPAQS